MSQRDARCGAKGDRVMGPGLRQLSSLLAKRARWDREIDNRSDHRRTTVRRRRPGSVVLLFARFRGPQQLHLIFPTLAFQLAQKYPEFRSHFGFPPPIESGCYTRIALQPDAQVDRRAAAGNGNFKLSSKSTPWMKQDDEPSSAILSVFRQIRRRDPRGQVLDHW